MMIEEVLKLYEYDHLYFFMQLLYINLRVFFLQERNGSPLYPVLQMQEGL